MQFTFCSDEELVCLEGLVPPRPEDGVGGERPLHFAEGALGAARQRDVAASEPFAH